MTTNHQHERNHTMTIIARTAIAGTLLALSMLAPAGATPGHGESADHHHAVSHHTCLAALPPGATVIGGGGLVRYGYYEGAEGVWTSVTTTMAGSLPVLLHADDPHYPPSDPTGDDYVLVDARIGWSCSWAPTSPE